MKTIALLALLTAAPVSAHIVLAPAEGSAGGYYAGVVRVSHGCDAAATTAVRVEIPADIIAARPQPKPGWTVEVERAPLSAPVQMEGKTVTDRVAAITWHGSLPADQFDDFGLMLKLPAKTGPLYLPVVQSCGTTAVRWTQIPAPGAAWTSVPNPAPVLQVVPATGMHMH